jgi:hypothetical protein
MNWSFDVLDKSRTTLMVSKITMFVMSSYIFTLNTSYPSSSITIFIHFLSLFPSKNKRSLFLPFSIDHERYQYSDNKPLCISARITSLFRRKSSPVTGR